MSAGFPKRQALLPPDRRGIRKGTEEEVGGDPGVTAKPQTQVIHRLFAYDVRTVVLIPRRQRQMKKFLALAMMLTIASALSFAQATSTTSTTDTTTKTTKKHKEKKAAK